MVVLVVDGMGAFSLYKVRRRRCLSSVGGGSRRVMQVKGGLGVYWEYEGMKSEGEGMYGILE